MSQPKAYDPQQGYMYQILCRNGGREWEHCDYAVSRWDKDYLLGEYQLAYGGGWEFKVIRLPATYHPSRQSKEYLTSMLEELQRLHREIGADGVIPPHIERRMRRIPYSTLELKQKLGLFEPLVGDVK